VDQTVVSMLIQQPHLGEEVAFDLDRRLRRRKNNGLCLMEGPDVMETYPKPGKP
jgi:hypothetical protein